MYFKNMSQFFRNLTQLLLVAVLFNLCGCAATIGVDGFQPGETVVLTAESSINGMSRKALVHIPRRFEKGISYPLVIVVHGAFSTAAKMEQETGFSDLADREGFVVMYPNGMGIFGLLQHWNAGHCCGKAAADDLDDVAFLDECIRLVKHSVYIDERKIYIAGFSNGGMLAHRYAAERSEVVAGMAALGASVGGRTDPQQEFWKPPLPVRPVSALLVHGMNDTNVPPKGGISPEKGGSREYLSLADSAAFWIKANSCRQKYTVTVLDNGTIEKTSWTLCADNSSVVVYAIQGWGHRWPGKINRSEGEVKSSFDGAEVTWKFFQEISR